MNGFAKVDGPSKIGRSLGIGENLSLSVLSKNQTVIEVWSKWTVIRLQVDGHSTSSEQSQECNNFLSEGSEFESLVHGRSFLVFRTPIDRPLFLTRFDRPL